MGLRHRRRAVKHATSTTAPLPSALAEWRCRDARAKSLRPSLCHTLLPRSDGCRVGRRTSSAADLPRQLPTTPHPPALALLTACLSCPVLTVCRAGLAGAWPPRIFGTSRVCQRPRPSPTVPSSTHPLASLPPTWTIRPATIGPPSPARSRPDGTHVRLARRGPRSRRPRCTVPPPHSHTSPAFSPLPPSIPPASTVLPPSRRSTPLPTATRPSASRPPAHRPPPRRPTPPAPPPR